MPDVWLEYVWGRSTCNIRKGEGFVEGLSSQPLPVLYNLKVGMFVGQTGVQLQPLVDALREALIAQRSCMPMKHPCGC